MAKLQPNFSWQKYEGKEENQKEQFQYQLQAQHIQVSNSVNATIDDASFFLTERQTSFIWAVGNKQIYTKTLATVAWTAGGTVDTIPSGVSGSFTVLDIRGYISNGNAPGDVTQVVPNGQGADAINAKRLINGGGDSSIILTSGGTDYSTYSGYVTIYYFKN